MLVRYVARSAGAIGCSNQEQQEDHSMNKDIFEGKWKQMRGQVKGWWGKLTDDDLDRAAGKSEQLIGLLQQKYGYTRERAEEEFNRRLKELKAD
jgi:uncharacterized protein YjbJ (UPF0337 family)